MGTIHDDKEVGEKGTEIDRLCTRTLCGKPNRVGGVSLFRARDPTKAANIASMRPRPVAVENNREQADAAIAWLGFNAATACSRGEWGNATARDE
jgi:hypothetical protein